MPRGTHQCFLESKEALALTVVDEHWAAQRRDWARALGGDGEPLQRLRGLFEETEADQLAAQQGCGTVSGCLFGNLTLELSNQAEAVRGRLQEIFDAQVDMVEAVIAEARARGDVTARDTREAARAVVAQLEGQVMFAKHYDNPGRLSPLWANCRALLGATGGE
ncbi:TetR family transcriptional regulator C-terminal domain-containing protein [Streptomyces sp. NPDC001604]|uniref:TetR family transcriptional regulator C-terminal domain-containing protein n=1 Tax=Streptomyces sp. NPDC001604 TaxID=3364593 RepID=UPI0036929BC7